MKRRLISAVTAAALALTTAFATPATAQDRNRDALKVLLGAATLGIVINEINKDKREKEAAAARLRINDNRRGQAIHPDWRWGKDGRGTRRHAAIPSECVFSIRGNRHHREVVSGRCMRELGAARRLPERCAFDINTRWGDRTVYGARCLQEHGYRIAGVRR